ncbi:MAG: hypothetical protein ABJG15_01425 [Hyphomonadaceae bacterium]
MDCSKTRYDPRKFIAFGRCQIYEGPKSKKGGQQSAFYENGLGQIGEVQSVEKKRKDTGSGASKKTALTLAIEDFVNADHRALMISTAIDKNALGSLDTSYVDQLNLQNYVRAKEDLHESLDRVIVTRADGVFDVLKKLRVCRDISSCEDPDDLNFSPGERLLASAIRDLEAVLEKKTTMKGAISETGCDT